MMPSYGRPAMTPYRPPQPPSRQQMIKKELAQIDQQIAFWEKKLATAMNKPKPRKPTRRPIKPKKPVVPQTFKKPALPQKTPAGWTVGLGGATKPKPALKPKYTPK